MGTSKTRLEDGRKVKLSAKWVESLGAGAVLTKGLAGCAMLMPAPIWSTLSQKLIALPMSADPWKRILLGNADDASINARCRLTIPESISAFAGCADEVAIVGVGHYLELWDPQRLADSEAKAISGPLATAIADFTF